MKNLLPILLFLFLALVGRGQNDSIEESNCIHIPNYGSSEELFTFEDSIYRMHSSVKKWGCDENVNFTYSFKDSSLIYLFITYNVNSSLKEIFIDPFIWVDSNYSSVISTYFETSCSGQIKRVTFRYMHGVEFGPEIEFFKNGLIKSVFFYANCINDTALKLKERTVYSNMYPFKYYEMYFKARNGKEYHYNENGEIILIGVYENDEKIGYWKKEGAVFVYYSGKWVN